MTNQTTARKNLASALTRPIVVLLLLQMMSGMMLSPHRTFFPIYVKELGHSALFISTLATIQMVMGLLASMIGGTMSDTWGRKYTLLLSQVGFLLGGLVFFTSSSPLIAVLWMMNGIGLGLHTLGGQSYLIDAASPDHLGVLSALYNWGYTLGGALSSPAAGFLLDRWDYRTFGTTLACFALGAIAVNLFLLPQSSALAGATTARFASWRKLFGYSDIAGRPAVIMLTVLRFLPTFFWGMAGTLIPLLLNANGADKTTVALYATVSQMTAALAQITVGRAADYLGPKWPTVITFVALVIGISGIGMRPGSLWSVFAFATLATAAAWSLSALLPSLVAQVTVPQDRGRVLGWIHLWWNVAMIVGAMVGGALFETWPGLPFLIAGALNLISIVLVFVFERMAHSSGRLAQPDRAE